MRKMEIKYITKNDPLVLGKKDVAKAKLPVDEKQSFWKLRGVSLDIVEGEAVGIIGTNGSGKEALIDILAGNTKQTTGFITIDGKINRASAQRGLDGTLTGLENIRKAIAATSTDEIKANHLVNAIINFTDLGEWLYRPVSDYSIGTYSCLSLGIALFATPKLVLLDSVLGNLDNIFYIKAAQKIQSLKDIGVSFIVADTNVFNIERFCERTMWLQFGEVQGFGPTKDVLEQFEYYINWFRALSLPEKNDYLSKKQKERLNFDVSSVYEEFKSEQFKHGFTRKDEPRMRKAFYKDHGADPVNNENGGTEGKTNEKKNHQNKGKSKNSKLKYLLGVLIIIFIAGGLWFSIENKIFAGFGGNKASLTASEKNKQEKSSKTKKSSEDQSKSQALSTSKAKVSSSQAAASSAAASSKASSESAASSAKASSESKAAMLKNTQTINVSDGDTLEGLAQKYATTADKIKEINNMNSDSQLKSGDIIRVPK
ncbi:ATP-binding cassette domain-containing protein [Liquorilactobacillus uvarum]|uniref:ATP-binding cassette domain-containing protein n=2 Tax=Liquorilactobacillus uvarum TaxID=303240 RepID=UPI00288A0AA7|nr:ATP-binding cassette domain-containing protein [Liquorilactobacillus uvarum]